VARLHGTDGIELTSFYDHDSWFEMAAVMIRHLGLQPTPPTGNIVGPIPIDKERRALHKLINDRANQRANHERKNWIPPRGLSRAQWVARYDAMRHPVAKGISL